MPGIFGGLGCNPERYQALRDYFSSIWGGCESLSTSNGILGGHAFAKTLALHVIGQGLLFAVDGEESLYRNALRLPQRQEPPLFRLQDNKLELDVTCKGNVAILDRENQILHLAVDWTGSFPLYYARVDGGLLFSSHLRPLAKVIDAAPDAIGILEFLRYAYILAGRSYFRGIRRLLPGQALAFELSCDQLRVYETSQAWKGYMSNVELEEIIERAWVTMGKAIQRSLDSEHEHALMTSAGWDSRLLLAGIRKHIDISKLHGFSHGDLQSREIFIAKQIYKASGIQYQLEPLDSSLYEVHALQEAFNRVENVVYPHWHRAGVRLKVAGINCVTAGLFGELIGGHYNKGYFLTPWKKMNFVASELSDQKNNAMAKSYEEASIVHDFLSLKDFNKPWYVQPNYWASIPNTREAINTDIKTVLDRLQTRDVRDMNQLFEAYLCEFHAAQCIAAQLLSCRAEMDIALPFGDQEVLCLSSRIPLSCKIHNSLSQAMLHRYAPDLLRFPTAAVLASAKSPIFIQEATRLLRKIYEDVNWRIYFSTHGYLKPTSLGWCNFEFLRGHQALQILIDDLKSDIFDKKSLETLMQRAMRFEWKDYFHKLSEQIMIIYTTDLMLR